MDFKELKNKVNQLDSFPPKKNTLAVIEQLLNITDIDVIDRKEYAELLEDLMIRLSDDFGEVTEEQSVRIIKWVENNWDEEDSCYLELVISIVMNLEINNAKSFVESKLFSARKTSTKKLLREVYEEFKY